MQIFHKNSLLWFALGLSLLLEMTAVGAWSQPTFGLPGLEARIADTLRQYTGINYSSNYRTIADALKDYSKERSSRPRFKWLSPVIQESVGQV